MPRITRQSSRANTPEFDGQDQESQSQEHQQQQQQNPPQHYYHPHNDNLQQQQHHQQQQQYHHHSHLQHQQQQQQTLPDSASSTQTSLYEATSRVLNSQVPQVVIQRQASPSPPRDLTTTRRVTRSLAEKQKAKEKAKDMYLEPSTPKSGRLFDDRVKRNYLKSDIIRTPRGSDIHSFHPDTMIMEPSPRRQDLTTFKRRLQFKNGVRCDLMYTEGYKALKRLELQKIDQRGKRDATVLKNRGLWTSLAAVSRTRQTRKQTAEDRARAIKAVKDAEERELRNMDEDSAAAETNGANPSGTGGQLQNNKMTKKKNPSSAQTSSSSTTVSIARAPSSSSTLASQSRIEIEKEPIFIPRHNLRPRPNPSSLPKVEYSERRKLKGKSKHQLDWKNRDSVWRKKRLDTYMATSKNAREAELLKKRNLTVCGWGNAQKNLGNYLSICWEYYPDLDAEKTQSLPNRVPTILNRRSGGTGNSKDGKESQGRITETGVIYQPDIISDPVNRHLNGYMFTIQSELALQFEAAQRVLFEMASDLVRREFTRYNMDLSLDSSLDDQFTVDIFISSEPSTDVSMLTVRGVSQFILMKGYIYVDKICVGTEHHHKGIGAFLMDRIFEIADKLGKDVLLYALGPVIEVYKKWGFSPCAEWPAMDRDIGVIMRKRIATKDTVDTFVGKQWDKETNSFV